MSRPSKPLSVVVWGNSVPVLMLPERPSREQGTYPQVLAECLHDAGIPANVRLEARWFDFLHRALRRYEATVRPHLPDVVVLQFGLNECQPWLLPVSTVRHLLRSDHAVGRTAVFYRTRIAARVWRAVRRYRRAVSPVVGTRTWQTTPRRFAGHLQRALRILRLEHRCLVLVLDVNPPGPLLEHWLAGMTERHAVYQRTIERVVMASADPDVRLVRVSDLVTTHGVEAVLPDGMHYTALGHRLVGELLAREISAWHSARTAGSEHGRAGADRAVDERAGLNGITGHEHGSGTQARPAARPVGP